MGSNGNLVFDPAEVTISAGESVHFVNNMLPPHNVIVEDHPELGHESFLAMMPGEEFDVAFPEAGDYTYWCGPHKGAGMVVRFTSNESKSKKRILQITQRED